jgi:diguanylate cyclase (GGDEF)-like protein
LNAMPAENLKSDKYQAMLEPWFGQSVVLSLDNSQNEPGARKPLPAKPPIDKACFLALSENSETPLGNLLVDLAEPNQFGKNGVGNRLIRCIHQIAACIVEDLVFERELNEMAIELSNRNEELNLIYELDDLTATAFNLTDDDIFSHLTKLCKRYSDVEEVYCLVPDFSGATQRKSGKFASLAKNSSNSEYLLARSLLKILQQRSRTVVINYSDDTLWNQIGLENRHRRIIGAPIIDIDGNAHGVLVVVNSHDKPEFTNSDRKLAEVLATRASAALVNYQDAITGLYNNQGFELAMTNREREIKGYQGDVAIFEVDNFESIYDSLGSKGSDELIRFITHLLKSNTDKEALLGRCGKAIFGFSPGSSSAKLLKSQTLKLQEIIRSSRFKWGDKMVDLTVSAGIALVSKHQEQPSQKMEIARIACNIAKENGKSRIHVLSELDPALINYRSRVDFLQEVITAMEQNRLKLFLQPIEEVSVGASEISHYEVLLRFVDKDGNFISPENLISVAEQFEIMPQVDRWVVHHALAALLECKDEKIKFSINLSGQSLNQEFSEFLEDELDAIDLDAERICFEITETAVISNLNAAINLIERTRARGCKFSLDDFGSGLSSFSYLQNIPVDYLKIDGSFVKDIVDNPVSRAIVDSINRVGIAMNLQTIAEYVENDSVLEAIREIGVHYGQGYCLGRPAPIEQVLGDRNSFGRRASAC